MNLFRLLGAAKRAISLLACVFVFISCRRSAPPSSFPRLGLDAIASSDDTSTKMQHFAEQAVLDAAKQYRTPLDYTPQSVESIERILDTLARSPRFSQFTDKDIRAEALIFGAYVGEVIRRQYGGHWAEDHPQAGAGSYPISWRGKDSFPYGWCYKRLTQGAEENVWQKYQYFVSKSLDPSLPVEVTRTEFAQ